MHFYVDLSVVCWFIFIYLWITLHLFVDRDTLVHGFMRLPWRGSIHAWSDPVVMWPEVCGHSGVWGVFVPCFPCSCYTMTIMWQTIVCFLCLELSSFVTTKLQGRSIYLETNQEVGTTLVSLDKKIQLDSSIRFWIIAENKLSTILILTQFDQQDNLHKWKPLVGKGIAQMFSIKKLTLAAIQELHHDHITSRLLH